MNPVNRLTKTILLALFSGLAMEVSAMRPEISAAMPLENKTTVFRTGGHIGERLAANERTWLQPLLENNPDMFGAFLRPDSNELFKCMWHGEFPGKILTGFAQTWLTSHDPRTRAVGDSIVGLLGRSQGADGYLGPWPAAERFEGLPEKWDTWGHYHCMYGLYQWYRATGNRDALAIACRAADCVYDHFMRTGVTLASQNWGECNFAVSHIFALLHAETGKPEYMKAAEHVVLKEWKIPYHDFYTRSTLCCDWLDASLGGTPFCHSNQKRWESLYTLTTLAPLYRITGDRKYYNAMDSLWWGIVRYDRHNTGSFGTGEGATGDIYGTGSETCNTVAWMTFSTEYLKLCRDSRVADELELSLLNATFGSQFGDKEFVYMNSSDGQRISSQVELAPHSYAGGREMNCCQASGNRGLSHFTQWGVLGDAQDVYLNYYGESDICTATPEGCELRIVQQTDYPCSGAVRITLSPERAERFGLKLRIPAWSGRTALKVNGCECPDVRPGVYYTLDRKWKPGDVVELTLDMAVHYWVGDGSMAGRTSVYYGPVLLSMALPAEEAARHRISAGALEKLSLHPTPGHWLCGIVTTADGSSILLEDYATKAAGAPYTTWLNVDTGLSPIASGSDAAIWNNRHDR